MRNAHGGRPPIRADRIRQIEKGFAFVPNRFLHEGFLASLTHEELALYVFLLLAGDPQGVSFYSQERIASTLGMRADDYVRVRNSLVARDLVAFDGRRFQVLSLPPKPLLPAPAPTRRDNHEPEDPATIRALIRASLAECKR